MTWLMRVPCLKSRDKDREESGKRCSPPPFPSPSSPRGSDVLSRYKQAKLAAGRPSGSRAARAHRQCQTFCHEVCFHWGQLNKPPGLKHRHVHTHSSILVHTCTSEHTQDNLLYFLPEATVSVSCLCCLCLCLQSHSVLQSITSLCSSSAEAAVWPACCANITYSACHSFLIRALLYILCI